MKTRRPDIWVRKFVKKDDHPVSKYLRNVYKHKCGEYDRNRKQKQTKTNYNNSHFLYILGAKGEGIQTVYVLWKILRTDDHLINNSRCVVEIHSKKRDKTNVVNRALSL